MAEHRSDPRSLWALQSGAPGRFSDAASSLDFDDPAFEAGVARGAFARIARNGARVFFGAFGGSGISDVFRFGHGVEINVNNFVLPTLLRRSYEADEARILLRASLVCDVSITVEGLPPMLFDRPELTLVCLPKGMRVTIDGLGGSRQQGINGLFRPSAFAAAYGLLPDDLPPLLRDAVLGSGRFGRVLSMPLDHRVASLVADTIDSELEGELRALQYAGRLQELVAYLLDAMRRSPEAPAGTAAAPAAPLRWHDADLAQRALSALAREYRQPPLVNTLAGELHVSAKRLQAAFKAAFGITMAEYCLERRMREAQRLLLEAKLSMAEVAERVGYAHQSNFTAAFSAHVGLAPREYKRHRAPVHVALDAALAPAVARRRPGRIA